MNHKIKAEMDQAGAALRSMAPMIVPFYVCLRKEDLSRLDAALISAQWMYVLTVGQDKGEGGK